MTDQQDFLVELGTEELPPKSLRRLAQAFADNLEQQVKKAGLAYGKIDVYATPRRLAVKIAALEFQQADRLVERRGPAISVAFDAEGNATPACEGFARSCETTVDQLERLETPKGSWVSFQKTETGLSVPDLMPDLVSGSLRKLPIPKPMRWGENTTEFVRPVHWALMLYGSDVIPASLLDLSCDRITYGHRFHHPEKLTVDHVNDYPGLLADKAYVIADFAERREMIVTQLAGLAKKASGSVMIDEDLLDEVTGLVEWPVALLGDFDKVFLTVPQEALIAAMKGHQKYFALTDQHGKLLPHFITISNIASLNPAQVIAGNERVMRARLADAAFFYETDRKVRLESRLDALKNVIFESTLGSVYDKAERIARLAEYIAEQLSLDVAKATRAGLLAKADLASDMVDEFPELQGIMGSYYAQAEGEIDEVVMAIREHYFPRYSGDQLPQTPLGSAVAIADKLDTIVSIFGINKIPTGEKDPYGLRRAAIGVLRIMIDNQLPLDLGSLLVKSVEIYRTSPQANVINTQVIPPVEDFLFERLRVLYADRGIAMQVITAVLANRPGSPLDFEHRIQAVRHFTQLPEAESLAVANKRVRNILNKANKLDLPGRVNADLLEEPAEKQLATHLDEKARETTPLYEKADYVGVLSTLATLREPIDQFFEHVTVMAEDPKIQDNRLQLLAQLHKLFSKVADISELQGV